jgi:hypothetical protein
MEFQSAIRIFAGLLLTLLLFPLYWGKYDLLLAFSESVPNVANFITGSLPGDAKSPTGRHVPVEIEPYAYYLIHTRISGTPEIHIDLAYPGYDKPEQELVIPHGPKEKYNYFFLFNSDDAPSKAVNFRIFFLDIQPIEVTYIDLKKIPNLAISIWKVIITIIILTSSYLFLSGLPQQKYRAAFLIFIIGFGLAWTLAINPLSGDNRNYAMVARSLLSDGDIKIDEFKERIVANEFYGVINDNGKLYNLFPVGPSLVLAPLYSAIYTYSDISTHVAEHTAGRLAVAMSFGVTLALFFLLVSRFDNVSLTVALGLTFIFGFCSHQLSQHVNNFASHNATMPFILAAFLALKSDYRSIVFFAGISLLCAYVMRPTAGLVVPLAGLWLWLYRKEYFWPFMAGCFIFGFLLIAMNLTFYGRILSPYSQIGRLGSSVFFEALVGNIISPNRGLLVFMPWIVFSLIGAWWTFYHKEVDLFFRLIVVIVGAHLLVVSSFQQWWGGGSYGPRFLAEMMPELVLMLIPFFQTPIWKKYMITRIVFTMTLVYALMVQFGGLTIAAQQWNPLPVDVDQHPERIWDWRDLQILRPLNFYKIL